jgi:large subunit ribosomal protein L5
MTDLQTYYREKIVPELMQQFSYKNVMQVPRVLKVTLNMGVGEAAADRKVITFAESDMSAIAGQKPLTTYTRKSVAAFKIRDGWPIGCKVTLRRKNMYNFLARLIHVAIPRTRDFRGYSARAFDGRGNYSLGIKEQIIFPEISYDAVDKLRGMDITITTSARTDAEGKALLLAFQFPLKEEK